MNINLTPLNVLNAVMSVAAIGAGLNPLLLGPHGAVIVGACVLALNVGHSLLSTPAAAPAAPVAPAVPPAVPKAVAALFVLVAVAALCAPLTACKTAPTVQEQAGISIAIDAAVAAAVQSNSTDPAAWKDRAQAFETIAKTVKAANDAGVGATLSTLQADLQPQLAKLGPADALAANALVSALRPYIDEEVAKNPSVGTTQATLDLILGDIITACAAYTGA